jgi:hypothetical protein
MRRCKSAINPRFTAILQTHRKAIIQARKIILKNVHHGKIKKHKKLTLQTLPETSTEEHNKYGFFRLFNAGNCN